MKIFIAKVMYKGSEVTGCLGLALTLREAKVICKEDGGKTPTYFVEEYHTENSERLFWVETHEVD